MKYKMEQMRRDAPLELPKARLCGEVVIAVLGKESDLDAALASMRAGLGPVWGVLTAFQFMSGKRGLYAAECAQGAERDRLIKAHRIAHTIGEMSGLTQMNLAELRAAIRNMTPDQFD